VKLNGFERWQLDMPILIGKSADWYRLWAGAKLLYTRFDSSIVLTLPDPTMSSAVTHELAGVHGNGVYVGGQAGACIGWRHVFIGFELTLAQLVSTAHLQALGRTLDVDISSFIIYPSVGLMLEI